MGVEEKEGKHYRKCLHAEQSRLFPYIIIASAHRHRFFASGVERSCASLSVMMI